MSRPGVNRALPGERVLWEGRPDWRALARDVLHIRIVALYWAVMLVWSLASNRADGMGRGQSVFAVLPFLVLGAVVLGAMALLARAVARTTHYQLTSERVVVRFGLALTATVSIPWRRVAAGSLLLASDGTGSIPLALRPGPAIGFLKLWPHARLQHRRTSPALRCIPDAARVGALVAQAARMAAPGRVVVATTGS